MLCQNTITDVEFRKGCGGPWKSQYDGTRGVEDFGRRTVVRPVFLFEEHSGLGPGTFGHTQLVFVSRDSFSFVICSSLILTRPRPARGRPSSINCGALGDNIIDQLK